MVRYFGGTSEVVLNPEGSPLPRQRRDLRRVHVRRTPSGRRSAQRRSGQPPGPVRRDHRPPATHELRFTTNTEGFETLRQPLPAGQRRRELLLLPRRPETLRRRRRPAGADAQDDRQAAEALAQGRPPAISSRSRTRCSKRSASRRRRWCIVRVVHRANQRFARHLPRAYADTRVASRRSPRIGAGDRRAGDDRDVPARAHPDRRHLPPPRQPGADRRVQADPRLVRRLDHQPLGARAADAPPHALAAQRGAALDLRHARGDRAAGAARGHRARTTSPTTSSPPARSSAASSSARTSPASSPRSISCS